MPEASFELLLKTAVVTFWAMAVLVQVLVFRGLKRRAADADRLYAATVRDHLVAELVQAGAWAGGLASAVVFGWSLVAWSELGWNVLLGVELVLAFVLLAVGAAALAARLSLDLVGRTEGNPALGVLGVRLFVLVGCGFHGVAVLWLTTTGFGETLFAAFALGVVVLVLGLNRMGDLQTESLERMVG